MTMAYLNEKDDIVYIFDPKKNEFVSMGPFEAYCKEIEKMNEEKDIKLFNDLKTYEKHWYIPVPFTKKRLIFAGLKYRGWYTYK